MLPRVLVLLLIAGSSFAQEDIPEVARSLMEDAARASEARRIGEAIAKYERVLELAPDVVPAYTNLGSLYYGQGNLERALEVFRRGLEKAPADRTLLTNAATAAQQIGRSGEALTLLDRALEREQRDATLYSLRSTILRSLDRNEEALTSIGKAIELAPREARHYFARGNLLFQFGRNDDAITAYQQAIALDRKYLRAWYNLGAALYASGRDDEAMQAYRVALDPIERAFAKKEPVDAAHAPAYANLGAIYLKLEQWPAAIDAYQKALRLDAKNASAHYSLGFVYYSTRQWDKAGPAYQAALELEPALPLAWLHLAQIALRKGEAAVAVDTLHRGKPHLEGATKLQALHTLGRAELARGNRAEARAAYEEALQNDPADLVALLALIRFHRSANENVTAAALLETAEKVAPANPSVLYERVLLARAMGEGVVERRALDDLLSRDPRAELWPLRAERFLLMLRENGVTDGPRELGVLIASAPPSAASTIPALRALRALLLAHAGSLEEARREAGAGSVLGAAIDALNSKRAEAIRTLTPIQNDVVAKGDLGILLWQQNRPAEARGPILEAFRARPDWREVSLALGEILLAAREWDSAASALAKCAPMPSIVMRAQSIETSIGRNDALCARSQQAYAIALLGAGEIERALSLPLEKNAHAAALFLRGVHELGTGSEQRARDSFTRSLALGLPPAVESAARRNLAAIEESLRVVPEPEEEPESNQTRRTVVVFLPDVPAENEKKLAEAVSASLDQVRAASGVPLDVELFRRAEDARAFASANRNRVGIVISNPEFISSLGMDLRARFQLERGGRPTYRRVVVVPAGSSVRTLNDLRGRSISVVDGLREPADSERSVGSVVRATDDLSAMANVLYGKTDAAYVSEDNPLLAQHAAEQRILQTSGPISLPVIAFAPMVENDREALTRGFRGAIAGHSISRIERDRPRIEPRRIEVATVPFAAFGLRLPEPPAIVPLRVTADLPVIAMPEDLYRIDE